MPISWSSGVPFSDPLADGPVIHAAATEALAGGATLEGALSICERIAGTVPVVPMVYSNMVLARGPAQFAGCSPTPGRRARSSLTCPSTRRGRSGRQLSAAGIPLVPLVAPTTPVERRRRICGRAEGFVYVVSDTRVTGERDELPARPRRAGGRRARGGVVPAAVGFGIGTPEQAAAVGRIADGVIIGTRLVRAVAEADGSGRRRSPSASSSVRCGRAIDEAGRAVG